MWLKTHSGEFKQMQPMWLCFFPGKQFDEKSQTNVTNVTMHIYRCKKFEDTFKEEKNTDWVQTSYTYVTNVCLPSPRQTLWQNIRKDISKLDRDIGWNIARSTAGLLSLKMELSWQKGNSSFSVIDLNQSVFWLGIS